MEAMFGSGTVLGHTVCGAPKVEGMVMAGVGESWRGVCRGGVVRPWHAGRCRCGVGARAAAACDGADTHCRRAQVLPLPEQCDIRLLQRIWTAKEAVYKLDARRMAG